MPDSIKVGQKSEIQPGSCKVVRVDGTPVAVINVEGTFYAIHDRCAHEGGPLSQGRLEGTIVFCPWHAFEFVVRTGQCLTFESLRVKSYEVEEKGDDLYLKTPGRLADKPTSS